MSELTISGDKEDDAATSSDASGNDNGQMGANFAEEEDEPYKLPYDGAYGDFDPFKEATDEEEEDEVAEDDEEDDEEAQVDMQNSESSEE